MIYTIITDEPLESWCLPKHEGQVVEVIEQSPLKFNPGMTTPVRRRYVASSTGYDDEHRLVWIEMPCPQGRR